LRDQFRQDEIVHHDIEVIRGVGIIRIIWVEPAESDRRWIGGGGKSNGIGFPTRTIDSPVQSVGESENLRPRQTVGQGNFRYNRADERIGAIFAVTAGVVNGIDLAGRKGAAIDTKLIQSAGKRSAWRRATKSPAQDIMVFPRPARSRSKSHPGVAGSIHSRGQSRHGHIGQHHHAIQPNRQGFAIKGDMGCVDSTILQIDAQGSQIGLGHVQSIGNDADRVRADIALSIVSAARPVEEGVKEHTHVIVDGRGRRVPAGIIGPEILHREHESIPAGSGSRTSPGARDLELKTRIEAGGAQLLLGSKRSAYQTIGRGGEPQDGSSLPGTTSQVKPGEREEVNIVDRHRQDSWVEAEIQITGSARHENT